MQNIFLLNPYLRVLLYDMEYFFLFLGEHVTLGARYRVGERINFSAAQMMHRRCAASRMYTCEKSTGWYKRVLMIILSD